MQNNKIFSRARDSVEEAGGEDDDGGHAPGVVRVDLESLPDLMGEIPFSTSEENRLFGQKIGGE